VARTPVPEQGGWEAYGSDYELQPLLQSSLEHTVSDAIDHLNEAFR